MVIGGHGRCGFDHGSSSSSTSPPGIAMIVLTSELEEEHIKVLQGYARTSEEKERDAKAEFGEFFTKVQTGPNSYEITQTPEQRERTDLEDALARELISRGLLLETPTTKVHRERCPPYELVEDVELEWSSEMTSIGYALLSHLANPESNNANKDERLQHPKNDANATGAHSRNAE
jgi:flagellar motility protein MotE (MotC chaperone)